MFCYYWPKLIRAQFYKRLNAYNVPGSVDLRNLVL